MNEYTANEEALGQHGPLKLETKDFARELPEGTFVPNTSGLPLRWEWSEFCGLFRYHLTLSYNADYIVMDTYSIVFLFCCAVYSTSTREYVAVADIECFSAQKLIQSLTWKDFTKFSLFYLIVLGATFTGLFFLTGFRVDVATPVALVITWVVVTGQFIYYWRVGKSIITATTPNNKYTLPSDYSQAFEIVRAMRPLLKPTYRN